MLNKNLLFREVLKLKKFHTDVESIDVKNYVARLIKEPYSGYFSELCFLHFLMLQGIKAEHLDNRTSGRSFDFHLKLKGKSIGLAECYSFSEFSKFNLTKKIFIDTKETYSVATFNSSNKFTTKESKNIIQLNHKIIDNLQSNLSHRSGIVRFLVVKPPVGRLANNFFEHMIELVDKSFEKSESYSKVNPHYIYEQYVVDKCATEIQFKIVSKPTYKELIISDVNRPNVSPEATIKKIIKSLKDKIKNKPFISGELHFLIAHSFDSFIWMDFYEYSEANRESLWSSDSFKKCAGIFWFFSEDSILNSNPFCIRKMVFIKNPKCIESEFERILQKANIAIIE